MKNAYNLIKNLNIIKNNKQKNVFIFNFYNREIYFNTLILKLSTQN